MSRALRSLWQRYARKLRSQVPSAFEDGSALFRQPLTRSYVCSNSKRAFSIAAADAATAGAPASLGPLKASGGGSRHSMGPILLLPAAVAAGLGCWQLARCSEKQAQIDSRVAAMQAKPVDLFAAGERPPLYTPVTMTGVLDEARSAFIGPRVRSVMGGTKPGKVVVSPLYDRNHNAAALVVRGWAPTEWQPSPSHDQATARVHGVIIESERPGPFVPANEPATSNPDAVGIGGQWFWLDGPAIAAAMGLPRDIPLVEQLVEKQPGGPGLSAMEVLGGRTGDMGSAKPSYPAPKSPEEVVRFPVMPQGHLNYAATWLAMSGCMGIAALLAMRGRKRRVPYM